MAATVLGKNALVPLFAVSATMVGGGTGAVTITDARITTKMIADVAYQGNAGATTNGGTLDATITAGQCVVTSSNTNDANNIMVFFYEGNPAS